MSSIARTARTCAGCLGGLALAALIAAGTLAAPAETPARAWADAAAAEASGADQAENPAETEAEALGWEGPEAPGPTGADGFAEGTAAENDAAARRYPALRVLEAGDGSPLALDLVAWNALGEPAPLPFDADEGLARGVDLLPDGVYRIGPADPAWTVVAAVADAGTEDERTLPPEDGLVTLEVPGAGIVGIDLLVGPAHGADSAEAGPEAPEASPGDGDDAPCGPDMSRAEATGMPMAGGCSSDPLEYLLQVVRQRQAGGSGLYVVACDPSSGAVEYGMS